ncbi:MAG: 2-hydroxyacyl-CoA dehydratase family protein [Deltaproteobacteria bacterium]|jgi:benzoyl-CoA reductase/2-hydroxyglutaryl-CoA dehydratase subunit BcrC/BadD/HgdB|nr:2-hydroxyacyl-CoA dehydratase family protein [Deltaproteobacteria bacterium]
MSEPVNIENMSAKEMLGYFQNKLDEEAREHKKEGKLVCWSSSVAPSEIFVTMDVALCYPETHAAGIGARHGALDMLEVTEQKGYSVDLCSYARINLAYMDLLKEKAITGKTPAKLEKCPGADIPLPDVVVATNNICNTLLKWYENLSYELNVPFILIDAPYNHIMPVEPHNKKYMAEQIRHAITVLEKLSGKPFDWEKFREVQKQTQRSVKYWLKIAEMGSYKPSPLNGFDLLNFMALIVCARSRDYAEMTFKKFVEELQQKEKEGKYAFGDNEQMRLVWEGIAVWPHVGHTFKSLKNRGMLMTGSTYPNVWQLAYEIDNLESIGESYSNVYTNTCVQNRARVLGDVGELGKCDGLILHQNRSCKLMCFLNQSCAEIVHNRLDIPYVMFDGDQTDPRNFSPAQYDVRVQSLQEMVTDQKRQ